MCEGVEGAGGLGMPSTVNTCTDVANMQGVETINRLLHEVSVIIFFVNMHELPNTHNV